MGTEKMVVTQGITREDMEYLEELSVEYLGAIWERALGENSLIDKIMCRGDREEYSIAEEITQAEREIKDKRELQLYKTKQMLWVVSNVYTLGVTPDVANWKRAELLRDVLKELFWEELFWEEMDEDDTEEEVAMFKKGEEIRAILARLKKFENTKGVADYWAEWLKNNTPKTWGEGKTAAQEEVEKAKKGEEIRAILARRKNELGV